jgi:hypothetical protein
LRADPLDQSMEEIANGYELAPVAE